MKLSEKQRVLLSKNLTGVRPVNAPHAATAFAYIIEIADPSGTSWWCQNGIVKNSRERAIRFNSFCEAAQKVAQIAAAPSFVEPLQIRILPAPESLDRHCDSWTVEEILQNAG